MQQAGEIDHEDGTRNYFQLERDKLYSFWEIAKKDLEALKAELRNKQRILEEDEERHQVEIKIYKQKLRHLLYEQKVTLDRLKIENENALKLQADEMRQKELQLKNDEIELENAYKAKKFSNQEAIKALKLQQEKQMTEMRKNFERELKQIQLRYQGRMKQVRESMEESSMQNVKKIEYQKNIHIKNLMQQHQKEFADIKKYFKVITDSNLQKVKQLNHEVTIMKQTEADNEKLMFEIAQSNKNYSEPLMKKLGEVSLLRKKLANYQKDKLKLKNTKSRLLLLEADHKKLKWDKEILFQSFEHLQQERDSLYESYQNSVHEVQQKTLLKNQLLQTKVDALRDAIEKKDLYLQQVLNYVQNQQ